MKKYEFYSAEERAEVQLFDNDVHYLNGEITEENVSKAVKWILSANLTKKPKRKLTLYINTVGGDLYEAFALIDVMRNSHHNISTIGIGAVMSAGFLIFASGKHGERYVGKNTGIMNHQHSDIMESKMHDMKAQMKENNNCEQRCMQILRDATGFGLADVRKKFNNPSDQYFTAKQLVDLKIADHIL
jgi:ATP-dependent Clp protease, protease subunit|tara:strand:+ start:536 stop:1096 length:561 start_codon:yes stop_codon:yes gene_type:complete|eukprot:GHVR01144432.1.p1 GENE.GHVR01144432.1~~GHVR01144432.1.p1  ORF type:complete len:187 (-),score=25.12 GHVR01144432.1:871-1431(-)